MHRITLPEHALQNLPIAKIIHEISQASSTMHETVPQLFRKKI